MFKIFITFTICSFNFIFSQAVETDSSSCRNNIKSNILLSRIGNSYRQSVKLPEETEPHIFGCGLASIMYDDEIYCEKMNLLLSKYTFILDQIRKNEKDEAKFKYTDVLWIQNISKEKRKRFNLMGENLRNYKQWNIRNQNSSTAIGIIVDKTDENTEYVQLKILFPREKREIIKEYKLYKSREKWQYETFYPKLTS